MHENEECVILPVKGDVLISIVDDCDKDGVASVSIKGGARVRPINSQDVLRVVAKPGVWCFLNLLISCM